MSGSSGISTRLRSGRMFKRGVTWWSALLVLALIVGGFIGLGALLRNQATEYDLTVGVVERSLTPDGEGCELVWRIRVDNPNDRRISLISFGLDDLGESTRRILGSVEPGGSIERDYRLPLDDCADAPAEGPTGLTTTFKLTGTNRERVAPTIVD